MQSENFDRRRTAHLGAAWVTGATGFLGRHVARHLARRGYSVFGFARAAVPADFAKRWDFLHIESGPFGPDIFRPAIELGGAPAVVFHAVGTGSVGQAAADPAGDFERTLGTTEQLVDFLSRRARSTRLIYPSSAAVYGEARSGPIAEETPAKPISAYGRTKLLTEEMCFEHASRDGFQFVAARFFSVIGPPQRKLILWELGHRLLSGEKAVTLNGTGDETRDFVFVADAADAVATLAATPTVPPIVNVGTGCATAIRTLSSAYAAALGVDVDIRFNGLARSGDPLHQQADISRLVALGHKSLTSLETGLAKYAEWLRKTVPSKIAAALDD